ncbi:hypothetical protein CAPTEDRAFT_190660 [Capitella teleta]|uniref:Uncharacterized protein n=1 Tax=Capitella teleta TaxID=283909 RepID=R7T6C6_CAPTE|nr:hypothetical protein CAPTEDRAFT_190660 [Capitella teleta]|eukprot:ELT88848.1 hypothetical protein CAPTEDRAFT_190660 [Capitella teleta]
MAAPNPFLAEDDLIENEIENDAFPDNPSFGEREMDSRVEFPADGDVMSLDHIAFHLLRENYVLTALELHTELMETGRELPRLRNFFSNPANFERTKFGESSPPGLARTSSIQTFDSLDFARYSDDGENRESDKVAVLEFELRKAQDTIRSLRATLTKTAETELPSPANEDTVELAEDFAEDEPIRQYEVRALNFLVNEYMLLNEYKLTSVTFAEENENQDFEDWDDVGLNLPKPPDLLHLYRDYTNHAIPMSDTCDAAVMVAMETEETVDADSKLAELEKLATLEEQIQGLVTENAFLSNQLKHMEKDSDALHQLKVRSSTPSISPITTPSKNPPIPPDENEISANEIVVSGIEPLVEESVDLDSVMAEQGSECPDLEVNDACSLVSSDVNRDRDEADGSSVSSYSCLASQRKMSPAFQKALLQTAFCISVDNRIITEVSKITDTGNDKVVLMLGRCLPHIVPNVLLAKREELIPLIICTATLHPDAKQRDDLLNILFNLIKRPDAEQRQMILTGCVAFAQHVGASRVESELLPQCWEQISHKYVERRQLVAEACGALAPYLPNEIVSSLVLSMLQQMAAEERAEEVRAAVTRSLGILMGVIQDPDKYSQGCQLLFSALLDTSEQVVSAVQDVFLPAFAVWAQELGRFEANLVQSLIDRMEDLVTKQPPSSSSRTCGVIPGDKQRFSLFVHTLASLIPVLFSSVLTQGPYVSRYANAPIPDALFLSSRFPPSPSELLDLSILVESPERLSVLLSLYENHINAEWFEPWEALNWVTGTFVPELITLMNQMDASDPNLVQSLTRFHLQLCRTFGRTFTLAKIRPRFQSVLSIPEESIDLIFNF